MSEQSRVEVRLRQALGGVGGSADPVSPDRAGEVWRRIRRDRDRRRATVAGFAVAAVLVAAGVGVGAAVGGGVPDSGAAVDRTDRGPTTSPGPPSRVEALLEGTAVPRGFAAAPLARLEGRGRGAEVLGYTQAVTCAWVSRWVAPGSETQRARAAEELSWNREWPLMQALAAAGDGYPAKVEAVAEEIRRDDLRPGWRALLGCGTFPGDLNRVDAPAPEPGGRFQVDPTSSNVETLTFGLDLLGSAGYVDAGELEPAHGSLSSNLVARVPDGTSVGLGVAPPGDAAANGRRGTLTSSSGLVVRTVGQGEGRRAVLECEGYPVTLGGYEGYVTEPSDALTVQVLDAVLATGRCG